MTAYSHVHVHGCMYSTHMPKNMHIFVDSFTDATDKGMLCQMEEGLLIYIYERDKHDRELTSTVAMKGIMLCRM